MDGTGQRILRGSHGDGRCPCRCQTSHFEASTEFGSPNQASTDYVYFSLVFLSSRKAIPINAAFNNKNIVPQVFVFLAPHILVSAHETGRLRQKAPKARCKPSPDLRVNNTTSNEKPE